MQKTKEGMDENGGGKNGIRFIGLAITEMYVLVYSQLPEAMILQWEPNLQMYSYMSLMHFNLVV